MSKQDAAMCPGSMQSVAHDPYSWPRRCTCPECGRRDLLCGSRKIHGFWMTVVPVHSRETEQQDVLLRTE